MNKKYWTPNNDKDYLTTISGIISKLNKEKILKETNIYTYARGQKFKENMEKNIYELGDELELDRDGDENLDFIDDKNKLILTNEQLQWLANNYLEE